MQMEMHMKHEYSTMNDFEDIVFQANTLLSLLKKTERHRIVRYLNWRHGSSLKYVNTENRRACVGQI